MSSEYSKPKFSGAVAKVHDIESNWASRMHAKELEDLAVIHGPHAVFNRVMHERHCNESIIGSSIVNDSDDILRFGRLENSASSLLEMNGRGKPGAAPFITVVDRLSVPEIRPM